MRWLTVCLVVILSTVTLQSSAAVTGAGVFKRDYAIFRNGSEIGTRDLSIVRNGDGIEVVNKTDIAVKIAFITVFRRHELLREVWRDGRLVRFSSRVNDDGKHFEVKAERERDGALRVEGAAGTYDAPKGTLPATYWHQSIVDTDSLIHVMRGKLQRVATTRVGEETLTVDGKPVKTTRYRMTGDERVDLWFDDSNLVVRVVYHNDGGSEIEFRATRISDAPPGLGLPPG